MKQQQYSPMTVAQMALVLYCANEGYREDVEVKDVLKFERDLLAFAEHEAKDMMDNINATGDWNAELEARFKELVEKFKSQNEIGRASCRERGEKWGGTGRTRQKEGDEEVEEGRE